MSRAAKSVAALGMAGALLAGLIGPSQARGHGSRKLGISYSTGYNAQAGVDSLGPVAWYYNWTPTNTLNLHGRQFVPMLELPPDVTPENLARAKKYGDTLLYMSEPDNNKPPVTVQQAVDLWPQVEATGMRIGSPAASPDNGRWLDQFLGALKARGYKAPDFICVHLYPDVGSPADPVAAADAMAASLQKLHDKYGKPIWITEWGLPPWGHPATAADNRTFMQAMLPKLERLKFVERYCWWTLDFPYPDYTINLADRDGQVLPLGRAYAQFSQHPERTVPSNTSAQVAKKGVGNYPGVPQAVADMNALHIGWYYDWGTAPVGLTPGIQFVPMIWGQDDVAPEKLHAAVASGADVLLGFNEPNVKGQSHMTVAQAIAAWPQLQATGLRLGSPATGTGDDTDPKGWLAQFMAQIKSHGYRVDFVCIHPYQAKFDPAQATDNLRKEIAYVHAQYGLPIWVTEYGLVNWDTNAYPDADTAAKFAASSAALMNGLPYVERYAWYSLIPNQKTLSLTNPDGSLNVIGNAWATAAGGVNTPTRWP